MQVDSQRVSAPLSVRPQSVAAAITLTQLTAWTRPSPCWTGLCLTAMLLAATTLSPIVVRAQTTPPATAVQTQSAADHIAMGDKANVARNASAALAHYEAALQIAPKNYEALWKASGSAIDLGEAEPDEKKRVALYAKATSHAREAIAVDSMGAESNFAMARGLGRTALTLGARDRVKYAKDVRMYALRALATDPKHAGAMHVMGVWNAEIMRLNTFVRAFAKTVLGGSIFSEASWASAARYMEQSVANDPGRAVHHLDLARVYRDMDRRADARAQYDLAIKAPLKDANDGLYQKQAADELRALK